MKPWLAAIVLFSSLSSAATLPVAELTLSTAASGVLQSVSGISEITLLDPQLPSCVVMQFRRDYAQKQVKEYRDLVYQAIQAHKQIDPQTQAELAALESRWLVIQKFLTEPWATATIRFPLTLPAGALGASLMTGDYQLSADLMGRHWEALHAELPDSAQFFYDSAQGQFVLQMQWRLQEYCFSEQEVKIHLNL